MKVSQTREAIIEPGYFVTDGEISSGKESSASKLHSHQLEWCRLNGNMAPIFGEKQLVIHRIQTPHRCYSFMVLLWDADDINDVYRGESFGGGDGTWGYLPQLVSSLEITTDPTVRPPVLSPIISNGVPTLVFTMSPKILQRQLSMPTQQSGNQKDPHRCALFWRGSCAGCFAGPL